MSDTEPRQTSLWHFGWIAVVVVLSVLFSLLISHLIHRRILWQYPFSAVLIACLVAIPLIYLIQRLVQSERALADHTVQQVTERLNTQVTLHESQARFSCAFHDAAIGMALVGIDGQWLQVNSALCELVGYTEQELLATTFQNITHPDDLDADLSFVQQMLAGEIQTYQMEKRYFHKQGQIVWILLSASLVRDRCGHPLYFIGQIQDITERKQIQDRLATSQMIFQAILDNSPNMIFIKNNEGGYVLVNRQFEKVFRLNMAAIVGKTDEEIFPAAQAAMYVANDRKVFETGMPLEFEEFVHQDDGLHTNIVCKFPLLNKDGEIFSIGGITTDITTRKRVEEALKESDQLVQQALEDRDRLSQDLHDHIIQSIYAIGLALDPCIDLVDNDPQAAAHKLRKGIADLNAVITHLREYVEWGSGIAIKGEQLTDALRELVRMITTSESFAIDLKIDPSIGTELTDDVATHVLHIVREALTNTLRHAKAKLSKVSLVRTNQGWHLDVQDDGIGFDPKARDGYGWGLRNMAARANKLHARFQLISDCGTGTRLSLDIPRT